jgi:Uma2 family endonuclease
MTTIQTEQTIADLLRQPDEKLYELVRGQLVEKDMGFLSSWVAWQISRLIGNYIEGKNLGWVSTEVLVACFPWIPNHARRPDMVYLHRDRLATPLPTQDPVTVAPTWVVEVLSPNDNAMDVDEKVEEYLRAGVELIWVVNPQLHVVHVHRANTPSDRFHDTDTITGGPVLPEFQAVVSDFFPKPQTTSN